jgi:hypothetical protein
MTQQTEASRLADLLEAVPFVGFVFNEQPGTEDPGLAKEAAAELRRLEAVNAQMLEALKYLQDWFDFGPIANDKARAAIEAAQVQKPVAYCWVNSKGQLTYGEMPHDSLESTSLYTPPAAQQEVIVPDDMSHAGQIKIKIAPDGDLHIIATGKDSWTGNDCAVAIELTASGGRDGAKWYNIFRNVMHAAATPPAAQPAVPEGYKLVPVRLTEKMRARATKIEWGGDEVDECWASMIAAAPEAPAQPAPVQPVAWEDLLGAIARGWGHPQNARKTMDVVLAFAIAKEIQNLYTTPPAAPGYIKGDTRSGLVDNDFEENA